MGYIAPVTQFDYIQYANRTIEAAENVRIVKGTTPIPPVRFAQVLERERGSFEGLHQPKDNWESTYGAGTYKYQMGMRVSEEITAKMTGKGRFFNEVV
ncbi:hypothetical protein FC678_03735 [Peribacillus simplex]|uniref:Uncharacterized protein n=1 Tax=Peribacillus simplex TaxID=1478 RepID=A0A9X9ETZ8_9BACI|nr:hypothetical protein [Peribacillus simplex]TKH14856.1 hypothetical protein FC678_03735 [Peribacillus simplex]